MFYRGNKKIFFLPGLISSLFKRAGVLLLDADEVLLMDHPHSPPFSLEMFYFYGQEKETRKTSSSSATAGSDGEDPQRCTGRDRLGYDIEEDGECI